MRRVLILLALGVLLARCEQQSDGDEIATVQGAAGGGAPSPSASRDLVAEMRQWAQCMRGQGFDVPDPYRDPASGKLTFGFEGPQKGDPKEERYVMAMQACEQYETYQEFDRRPFSDEQMALWRVYTQCMRDNGVELADPDQASGIPPIPDPRRYRGQEALMQRAMDACLNEFTAARTAGGSE